MHAATRPPASQSITPRYLSVQSSAAYSGLGIPTIRRLLRERKLTPYRPVPGRVLVSLRELDELLERSADQRCTRGTHLQPELMAK